MKPYPECYDKRKCFGQTKAERCGEMVTMCTILHTSYPEGKCPFQKEKRLVTDGVTYPYKVQYGKSI